MTGPSLSRRGIERRAWLAGALAVAAGTVGAQAPYPTRPITLPIGSGAGSGADLLSRLVAEGLADALGQPVIAENRAGAGGAPAALSVVRASVRHDFDVWREIVRSNGIRID